MAPNTHREIFFNAPLNVGQGLATFGALDHSLLDVLDTINDVAGDVDAFDEICTSEAVCTEMGRSENAMNVVANKNTATESISESQTALDALLFINPAHDKLLRNGVSMSSLAASQKAVETIISNQSTRDTTRNNNTPADKLTSSELAMELIAESTHWEDYFNGNSSRSDISTKNMAAGKMLAGVTDTLDATNFADVDQIITEGQLSEVRNDADGDTVLAVSDVGLAKYLASIAGIDYTNVNNIWNLWSSHDAAISDNHTAYQKCNEYSFILDEALNGPTEEFISSPYMESEIWSKNSIGDQFWADWSGADDYTWVVQGPDGNQNALEYDDTWEDFETWTYWDLTDYDTLKFQYGYNGSNSAAIIELDGTVEFSGTSGRWTQASVDISSYSGSTKVAITDNNDVNEETHYWSHFVLE